MRFWNPVSIVSSSRNSRGPVATGLDALAADTFLALTEQHLEILFTPNFITNIYQTSKSNQQYQFQKINLGSKNETAASTIVAN